MTNPFAYGNNEGAGLKYLVLMEIMYSVEISRPMLMTNFEKYLPILLKQLRLFNYENFKEKTPSHFRYITSDYVNEILMQIKDELIHLLGQTK